MANATSDSVSISQLGLVRVDTAEEADPIIKLIKTAKRMRSLCLSGTSVGVKAAEAIGSELTGHPELEEALWADMFVSRLKSEIPEALKALGNGLLTASCRLTVLDLSDNAVGPVGFRGLASWLTSSVCYGLQELKLNNTGMGPQGACLLADALAELVDSAKSAGGFRLKSFVCGRSRLENEGARRLSEVFSRMGHLEKLAIPQDGIGHEGIAAICNALKNNPSMRHIDFSDNTLTRPGSEAVANLLKDLRDLEVLNLSDCLLGDDGALAIASALEQAHLPKLSHLSIQYNELGLESVMAVVESLEQKEQLERFEVSGNPIGRQGADQVEAMLDALGKANVLGELVEIDEEFDDDEEEEEEGDEEIEEGEYKEDGTATAENSGRFEKSFDDKSLKNSTNGGNSLFIQGVSINSTKAASSGKPSSSNPLLALFADVVASTESRSASPTASSAVTLFKKVPDHVEKQWAEELATKLPCTLELTLHLLVQLASAVDGHGASQQAGFNIETVSKFADMILSELKAFYTSSPVSPLTSFDNALASAFLSAFGLVKGEALRNARRALPTRGGVWRLVTHLDNQPYFSGASRIIRAFLDATAASGWGVPFSPGSHQDLVRRHLLGSLSQPALS